MDPNATVSIIRKLIEQYENVLTPDECTDIADELVYTFGALDTWLSNGGFLPTAWNSIYDKTEDEQ